MTNLNDVLGAEDSLLEPATKTRLSHQDVQSDVDKSCEDVEGEEVFEL